jgi:hypothetical protein
VLRGAYRKQKVAGNLCSRRLTFQGTLLVIWRSYEKLMQSTSVDLLLVIFGSSDRKHTLVMHVIKKLAHISVSMSPIFTLLTHL